MPNDKGLMEEILKEAHELKLATHPSSTKMYRDLKSFYWWLKIKKEIAEFMAKYAVNQQVKIEHQKLTSGLQPFSISKWKWEDIRMDFVTGLPKSKRGMTQCGWL
jgi:hypothetical protein